MVEEGEDVLGGGVTPTPFKCLSCDQWYSTQSLWLDHLSSSNHQNGVDHERWGDEPDNSLKVSEVKGVGEGGLLAYLGKWGRIVDLAKEVKEKEGALVYYYVKYEDKEIVTKILNQQKKVPHQVQGKQIFFCRKYSEQGTLPSTNKNKELEASIYGEDDEGTGALVIYQEEDEEEHQEDNQKEDKKEDLKDLIIKINQEDMSSLKMVEELSSSLSEKELEDQLEGLLEKILVVTPPTLLLTEQRSKIAQDLKDMLDKKYPKCVLHPYGMDEGGLGDQGDGLSLYADLWDNVLSLQKQAWENKPLQHIAQIFRTLKLEEANGRFCKETKKVGEDRVTFIHLQTGLRVHIRLGPKGYRLVKEAELIKFLISLDPRVKPLLVLGRYWASVSGILNSLEEEDEIKGRFLVLLMIFHLANRNVIPTMLKLQEEQGEGTNNPLLIEGVDLSFLSNPSKFSSPHAFIMEDKSIMTLSALSLFQDFLQRLGVANFKENAISLWLGKFVEKKRLMEEKLMPEEIKKKLEESKTPNKKFDIGEPSHRQNLWVQDLFDLTSNIGLPLDPEEIKKFQMCAWHTGEKLEETVNSSSPNLMEVFLMCANFEELRQKIEEEKKKAFEEMQKQVREEQQKLLELKRRKAAEDLKKKKAQEEEAAKKKKLEEDAKKKGKIDEEKKRKEEEERWKAVEERRRKIKEEEKKRQDEIKLRKELEEARRRRKEEDLERRRRDTEAQERKERDKHNLRDSLGSGSGGRRRGRDEFERDRDSGNPNMAPIWSGRTPYDEGPPVRIARDGGGKGIGMALPPRPNLDMERESQMQPLMGVRVRMDEDQSSSRHLPLMGGFNNNDLEGRNNEPLPLMMMGDPRLSSSGGGNRLLQPTYMNPERPSRVSEFLQPDPMKNPFLFPQSPNKPQPPKPSPPVPPPPLLSRPGGMQMSQHFTSMRDERMVGRFGGPSPPPMKTPRYEDPPEEDEDYDRYNRMHSGGKKTPTPPPQIWSNPTPPSSSARLSLSSSDAHPGYQNQSRQFTPPQFNEREEQLESYRHGFRPGGQMQSREMMNQNQQQVQFVKPPSNSNDNLSNEWEEFSRSLEQPLRERPASFLFNPPGKPVVTVAPSQKGMMQQQQQERTYGDNLARQPPPPPQPPGLDGRRGVVPSFYGQPQQQQQNVQFVGLPQKYSPSSGLNVIGINPPKPPEFVLTSPAPIDQLKKKSRQSTDFLDYESSEDDDDEEEEDMEEDNDEEEDRVGSQDQPQLISRISNPFVLGQQPLASFIKKLFLLSAGGKDFEYGIRGKMQSLYLQFMKEFNTRFWRNCLGLDVELDPTYQDTSPADYAKFGDRKSVRIAELLNTVPSCEDNFVCTMMCHTQGRITESLHSYISKGHKSFRNKKFVKKQGSQLLLILMDEEQPRFIPAQENIKLKVEMVVVLDHSNLNNDCKPYTKLLMESGLITSKEKEQLYTLLGKLYDYMSNKFVGFCFKRWLASCYDVDLRGVEKQSIHARNEEKRVQKQLVKEKNKKMQELRKLQAQTEKLRFAQMEMQMGSSQQQHPGMMYHQVQQGSPASLREPQALMGNPNLTRPMQSSFLPPPKKIVAGRGKTFQVPPGWNRTLGEMNQPQPQQTQGQGVPVQRDPGPRPSASSSSYYSSSGRRF